MNGAESDEGPPAIGGLEQTRAEYDRAYAAEGFAAQRLYPNEELLRFLGRNFFGRLPREQRAGVRVLEVGCGSGANLWMLAREGFSAHGLELSAEALVLCRRMLEQWSVCAELHHASMTEMPLVDASFEVIVDVFSSNCLEEAAFRTYLGEARRVLAADGLLFGYTPSTASDAWTRHAPATLLDAWTLSGIHRADAPFAGNHYPFRFESPEHLEERLREAGFALVGCERIGRTYRGRAEYFEFLSYEARAV